MRAVNLYTLTRKVDNEIHSLYEKALSDREGAIRIRDEEIEMIRMIISQLMVYNAKRYGVDNWFYSFTIPQIGKEFDLLKIGKDGVIINIELKSQEVKLERVERQLKQNRYYLGHIAQKIYSFTCMRCDSETINVYKYENDTLQRTNMEEMVSVINTVSEAVDDNIEKMFSPKDYLNAHLQNVSVTDAKSVTQEWLGSVKIVCVDETQRLYKSTLDMILKAFKEGTLDGCVFSYDQAQALSIKEVRRNNAKRLNSLDGFTEEKLTYKIRTNKEMISFVRNMMRLSDRPHEKVQYDNIDVLYANDIGEADWISRLYQEKGYTFIAYTPSKYVSKHMNYYSDCVNSHQVIGQEFDKVIVIIDKNFRYDSNGKLEGIKHYQRDYLFTRLFYQNISRTREKLCLIVLDNADVFEKILMIKENCLQA